MARNRDSPPMTKPITELIAELKTLGAKATPGPINWPDLLLLGQYDWEFLTALYNNLPTLITAYEEQAKRADEATDEARAHLNECGRLISAVSTLTTQLDLARKALKSARMAMQVSLLSHGCDPCHLTEAIDAATAALTPNPPTNKG